MHNIKDFEIMAPVGSRESLAAAIQAGADSIYFGIENLNMRARSANTFTIDDLKEIARTCDEHGMKSYLTVNTIIYDNDLALMRTIPGMVILNPADAPEAKAAVRAAAAYDGPVYLRLGRLAVPVFNEEPVDFTIGKGQLMRDGTDVTIIATGLEVAEAMIAADTLAAEGIDARVVNMATIKPIDKDLILACAAETGAIVTTEEANVMGGLGLMQERISQQNHDDLGWNGWEISAHHGSAPDHEPYQGKQYPDDEYQRLNNSLVRPIGELNCGHAASPIILGVNSPQYTPEELEAMRQENEEGVTFDGKHYTLYEATQRQRKFERSIRDRKRRILIDETVGDKDKLQQDQIRLQVLKQEYARFSKGVGLPMQHSRMEKAGFTWKHGKAAESAAKTAEKAAKLAREKERLLKSIKESGIIHKADVPPEQRGYTAEQYQDMLTKRTKVSLGGDISSLKLDGIPNSITDLVREDGQVKTRIWACRKSSDRL